MKRTDKYPYWVYSSLREFKQDKRQYVKSALKVLSGDGASGIFYSPAYELIEEARRLLEEAEKIQSVKEWGQ